MKNDQGCGEVDRSPRDSFSIRKTVAGHLTDPAYRFHALGKSHDFRSNVAAGEARQRVRGRRHTGKQ
jgi:hypothetical protein